MYCAACNLHYPDHLNFCRRCGQALGAELVEPATGGARDSFCCTRCGARGVSGERFCQQCGYGYAAAGPETIIGGCHYCATSWRTGWLFCRKCGADRDSALMLSTSMGVMAERAGTSAELNRGLGAGSAEMEKIFCKRCGAGSKPYSKFCESCGNPLDAARGGATTGKLKTPPAAATLRTQLDASQAEFREADLEQEAWEAEEDARAADAPPVIVRGPRYDTQSGKTGMLGQTPVTGGLRAQPTAPTGNSGNPANTTGRIVPPPPFRAPGPAAPAPRATIPAFGTAFTTAPARSAWPKIAFASLLVLAATTGVWAYLKNRGGQFGYGAGSETALLGQASPQPAGAITPAGSPQAATTVTPQPSATPGAVTVEVAPNVAAPEGMVYVPGGTFEMGRLGGDEYESPPHQVTVAPFLLDRTEVTNEEYQRFIEQTNHRAPPHWKERKHAANDGRLPVVNVSWTDANDFAAWARKRLPTEAEWELAARGTDGRLYPWGNTWDPNLANAGRDVGGGRIVAVGTYNNGPSPFQALDLCGNVWEWTASKLVSYQDTNREIAPGRVIRGGAYDVAPQRATTTYRGVGQPEKVYEKTGFRCARNAN